VHLVERDPQSLLAPQLGAHGFANVMTIEALLRRRLDTRIALASVEEMEQVSHALRAAQDL
jgi:mRNA-degrading endonuclease toxin of MazEF toxin-antitoxin module